MMDAVISANSFKTPAVTLCQLQASNVQQFVQMRQSRKFEVASFLAWVWNIILLVSTRCCLREELKMFFLRLHAPDLLILYTA